MERHEKAETRTVTLEEMKALGFDPDYNQACIVGGSCGCYGIAQPCSANSQCFSLTNCTVSCPPPSKANSHYVSTTCVKKGVGTCACWIIEGVCYSGRTCTCSSLGVCYYSCDAGYAWNPVTLQCDLVPVVSEPIMDGFTYVD